MEELVILQYGSFAALGKRASMMLSEPSLKRVTEQALWGQLYLDELRRDHLGWSTAHHQEWGLFLLDHLLHNTAAIWQKERERTTQSCPQAQPIEMAEVTAPTCPSVRILLVSTDREILDLPEKGVLG